MPGLIDDVRFAIRMLGRQKLLTAVATFTLALGIGANTAIFSTVSGILLNSLPYTDSDRLVALWGENRKQGFNQVNVSYIEAEQWRAARSLEAVSPYRYRQVGLRGAGEPQSLQAVDAGAGFFEVLGEKAALGRTFSAEEQQLGDRRVAVITAGLWQREFGGDAQIVGREMQIDGRTHTVIGVMPPDFNFLYSKSDVFLPLQLTDEQRSRRDNRSLRVIGRLKVGRTVQQADAEIKGLAANLEASVPQQEKGWSGNARPLDLDVIDRGARTSIKTMFWAVLGVLLIACTNIASLLLARGTLRQRELAIRAALGAGQSRIARLLITESLVLSLLGGIFGVAFAAWAIPVLRTLAPKDFPRLEYVQLNAAALAYTLLIALICGLIAGAAPAWMLTRGELARTLHEGGRGGTFSRQRLLQGLVATEVALAMVLLTLTGLLVRNLTSQLTADPGFDKTHLITATVTLPESQYPEKYQQAEFFRAAVEALRRDSRVENASAVQTIPLGGSNSWTPIAVEGKPDTAGEPKLTGFMAVLPHYFDTMKIPLLTGRDFTEADKLGSPEVAVINQTMARRFWPDDPRPVGRRFKLAGSTTTAWYTIVGISRDVRHQSAMRPARPEMYLPVLQGSHRRLYLVARTHDDPAQAASALRNAVWSVDRNQPVAQMETMEELIDRRVAGPRVTVQILGFLAALALLLASLGIYGVLSYLTSQRAKEIGIRVAMGAVRGDVVRLVLSRGLLLTGIGLTAGIAAAAALTPLVRSILDGVQPHDLPTFTMSAVALLMASACACVVPVFRALGLDPVRALRDE